MANKEALRELQQRLAERLRLARESAPTPTIRSMKIRLPVISL